MNLGTINGFALLRRRIVSSGGGGGGGGEQIRWAQDTLNRTTAWVSGALTIAMSQTPVDLDGIIILSEGQVLHPDDYTILTGPYRVQIDFAADPVTDTDDGVWNFVVSYPYLL